LLQRASSGLYGYDAWFHIRYAQVLRSEGFSRTFPWWQETFLRDHFADKDFLYHVLLIPFTFADLVVPPNAPPLPFAAASIVAFHLVSLRLRVPWPSLWSLALLAGSMDFLYRIAAMRPLALAVALALGGTAAILSDHRRAAFAFAALYPHAHVSFHLLPCIALLHDAVGEPDRPRSFALTRWTAAGAAAGAVLSPYFPNNLHLWWVQNVRVLALAWSDAEEMRLGADLLPRTSSDLLELSAGVFAALLIGVYLLVRSRRRGSHGAVTLFLVSSGFLGLTMLSRRFIEF